MNEPLENAVAIVGVGAILPDAPNADAFWRNVTGGVYSISEVDPARWDPSLYYDPDPKASEKTYSTIGGWVRDWDWNPLAWKLPIPPKVSEAMDDAHKWAVACTRMALMDAGWPARELNLDRTAVIIGNAISGEHHYLTTLRIMFPELARELEHTDGFAALPADVRATIERELRSRFEDWLPGITEDTMPGELGNCMAGRVANLFNFHGPNFTTDAACASALAALDATVEGLLTHEFDVAITGGVDRNMGASSFVKFCAIGALSPTGTRPYADGADGFVMGEGGALFVVKRLADAVGDGDTIYAVVRGVGSASDGKGKGITAPNPVGQRFAVERAWQNAGLSPADCSLIEGHGTSTRVGDAVELGALSDAFAGAQIAPGSIALGSVKSNIGHLKAAAGAAGLLKATLSLHNKMLPPSINFERPNPNLDWSVSPFAVNTELRDWDIASDHTRVAGVSAFGFGGTNFHVVLEEYIPGRAVNGDGRRSSVAVPASATRTTTTAVSADPAFKTPLRGSLVLGADSAEGLANELRTALAEARQGRHLDPAAPNAATLRAPERIAIDYADGDDLATRAEMALRLMGSGNDKAWPALRGRGIYRVSGAPGKVAFLFTGQGSQYANMLADIRDREPVVEATFEEADAIMSPLLEGRQLTDIIFAHRDDPAAIARAEEELRRTEITQPAVITVDVALTRLLAEYGIAPDMVMGHSVGEYGALVAAGAMSFTDAIEAVSARGREMAHIQVDDPGMMAAAIAPLAEVEELVAAIDGYVVLANINSTNQVVVGGASAAVKQAVAELQRRGYTAIPLPVSHAFHTEIVASVGVPLGSMLQRLGLHAPIIPVVANVNGEFYPTDGDVPAKIVEMLSRQVASPVQFVKGLRTLFDAGARVFVEVGPKHALQGFASDVLGDDTVMSVATNHPKAGDIATFNSALCGLWACGLGAGREPDTRAAVELKSGATAQPRGTAAARATEPARAPSQPAPPQPVSSGAPSENGHHRDEAPVVITGAALGLPGADRLFDEGNIARLLAGEQGIDVLPGRMRREMLDKHITRLVKSDDGGASFEMIDRLDAVIKLAARSGLFDLGEEFGVDADRLAALGHDTQLAIAAGIDALRDAGIPLVLNYKTTTRNTQLPDRWSLPESIRDETGVIFASAFPGLEEMTDEVSRYTTDKMRRERLAALESLRARMLDHEGTDAVVLAEVERRIHDLNAQLEAEPYTFDRRFLFRILSMGHSQLAELIGARGPNTQVNAACASTTQAVAIAEDWIRAGRCQRVLIVAADDATSDTMMPWIGAGFLASGAAATDDIVEEAALPFDERRHGMLIGMGAAALVVESAESARERGLSPICEVLGSVVANSAFHGTRLDVSHISGVMEKLVSQAEARGVVRSQIAGETVFVSHETYTPARGGSAAAEIHALRQVFGNAANQIVIANVKGYTGHPMGVGLEDVMAVKSLETGVVPAVPNFRDPDPELGLLNLSQGGAYPIRYALRLAAGFGSQIAMLLLRWVPAAGGRRRALNELGYSYRVADQAAWARWLRAASHYESPQLEVAKHRLRVVDQGPPNGARAPIATPAAVAASVASPPAPVAPLPVPSDADLEARVLEIVAEQTGYPTDLLDMELDLEADLGIDTVKQAEVFASIRELYGIERDDGLKLRDYPTLNHVVGFVRDRAPGAAAAVAASAVPAPAAAPVAEPEPVAAPEPAPAEPAPAAFAAEGPASSDDDIAARVLEVVAEQTGYPTDLLDMELDLEADLGIDTVKQAEVFASIRELYGIERDDALKLRDYPTLNHVVGFVRDRAPAPAEPEPAAVPAPAPLSSTDAEGFPRRVPVPVPRPPLQLCLPTGITIGLGSRIVVMPDEGGVVDVLTAKLTEAGADVLTLKRTASVAALETQLGKWIESGPIDGVFWLPGLDLEGLVTKLSPAARRDALHVRVKLLAASMRALPESTFLVSGTRLGGRHGYDEAGSLGVLGGAVTGFTKALSRERADTVIKAVDFGSVEEAGAERVAQTLLDETTLDPGAVEIGHADELRWSVALVEREAEHDAAREPDRDTVFLVTGAAGSIVSAIVIDLAVASGATFHLVDLVAEPDRDDADLARFAADRDGLKRELADRIRERGERPTPKLVERDLARIERSRAALNAIEAVEHAGGTAHWHQVDLTDARAVATAVKGALTESGRIDVVLHAAGLEISHFLPDKPQAEYDLVFDVKAYGWLNLLAGFGAKQPGAAVMFSSIAGRFGNGGQTDYSAANDLLCKSASHMRRGQDTRGVAIDWTAWASIGMASRGSIPKMMEVAGIDMLPVEVGLPVVRRELTASGSGGEVLEAGSLGVLEEERHPTGGLDTERATAARADEAGPMTGRIESFTARGQVTVVTELDPNRQPFLFDHRIDGTPVLPGVMGMEGFAEAAAALVPGFHVVELTGVDLVAPFKFYRDEPRSVILRAMLTDGGDGTLLADCELIGRRELRGKGEQETRHFVGRARLARKAPAAPKARSRPDEQEGAGVGHDAVYGVYFHGPAYQVLERAWRSNGQLVGQFAGELPANHEPASQSTEISPRLIELCFQTAGVWEIATEGRMALPTHVDRVVRYASAKKPSRLWAVVTPLEGGVANAEIIDEGGRVRVRLEGYRTIALPGELAAGALAPFRSALNDA